MTLDIFSSFFGRFVRNVFVEQKRGVTKHSQMLVVICAVTNYKLHSVRRLRESDFHRWANISCCIFLLSKSVILEFCKAVRHRGQTGTSNLLYLAKLLNSKNNFFATAFRNLIFFVKIMENSYL